MLSNICFSREGSCRSSVIQTKTIRIKPLLSGSYHSTVLVFPGAVQYEAASKVAMVRASNIPISFLLQALFLERPDPIQWLGAALVFGAIVMANVECAKDDGDEEDSEVLEEEQSLIENFL